MNEDSVDTGRRNFLIGATTVVGSAGVVGASRTFRRVLESKREGAGSRRTSQSRY